MVESAQRVEGEPGRLQVVGAVLFWENDVLIGQRRPDSPAAPLKLEFIGGKYDDNMDDSLADTLVREMWEEMRMQVVVLGEYARNSYDYSLEDGTTLPIELICFECTTTDYSFKLVEVHNAWWMPRQSLPLERFAEADIPIAEKVIAEAK